MSYERKVIAGVSLIAAIFIVMLIAAIFALSAAVATQRRFETSFARNVLLAEDLKADELRQNRLVPIFTLTGAPFLYNQIKATNHDVRAVLVRLREEVTAVSAKSQLDAIVRDETALEAYESPGIDLSVKRRAIGTPYRRPIRTPLALRFAVARRRSAEPLAERSA